MSKREYNKYQTDVIKRYYDKKDVIMLQKLQELVTELYLAKDSPKEDKIWERAHKAMLNLKVKPALVEHIMVKRDVEVLAENVQVWFKRTPGK